MGKGTFHQNHSNTSFVLEAAPTTAAVGHTIVQHGAPGHGPVQISTVALEALLQQSLHKPMIEHEEEKKERDSLLKVSQVELKIVKTMCGCNQDAPEEVHTAWFLNLFKCHQDDKDKAQTIADMIDSHFIFEESKPPCILTS